MEINSQEQFYWSQQQRLTSVLLNIQSQRHYIEHVNDIIKSQQDRYFSENIRWITLDFCTAQSKSVQLIQQSKLISSQVTLKRKQLSLKIEAPYLNLKTLDFGIIPKWRRWRIDALRRRWWQCSSPKMMERNQSRREMKSVFFVGDDDVSFVAVREIKDVLDFFSIVLYNLK